MCVFVCIGECVRVCESVWVEKWVSNNKKVKFNQGLCTEGAGCFSDDSKPLCYCE